MAARRPLQALGARLVSDPALIAKLTAVPSLQHLLSELLADPVLLESVVHNDEARTHPRTALARAHARSRAALGSLHAQLVGTLTSLVERLEVGDDSFEATVQLFRSDIARHASALSASSDLDGEDAEADRPQGRARSEPPRAVVPRMNPATSFALYAVHDILSECARELLSSAWARWRSTPPQSKRAAGGVIDESAALRAQVAALEAQLLEVRRGARASLLRAARDFSERADWGWFGKAHAAAAAVQACGVRSKRRQWASVDFRAPDSTHHTPRAAVRAHGTERERGTARA